MATAKSRIGIGIAVLVLGLLVLPFGGLYVYGWVQAPEYQAEVRATLPVPVDQVFDTLSDPDVQRSWRPGVTRVQEAPPIDGDPVLLFTQGGTELALRLDDAHRPDRVVWSVVPSKKHVFGATWVYLLSPAPGGTEIHIVENGIIDEPFSRGATELLLGFEGFSKNTVRALARHHGVEATFAPVERSGTSTPEP